MRTCFLHIGMNKSGSTSIQHAFRGYRDRALEYLQLQEWAAPFKDNGNHSRHIQMRFGRKLSPKLFSSPDPAEQRLERERLARDFDAGVASAAGSVIISGETMVDMRSEEIATEIAQYLRDRFDHVQGIVYVRDPSGYMKSLLQQSIRVRPLEPGMGLGAHYPGYRRRFVPWERALGQGNLSYIPFDNAAFPEGDLLLDFARRTGIPDRFARKRGAFRQTNVSLSAEAVAALARYRMSHGARPPHGPGRAADIRLVSGLMELGSSRFALAAEAIAPVLESHRKDLDWIESRLGRSFPAADPSGSEIGFATTADLMDYAAGLGPVLQDWQARLFPRARPAGTLPEDILLAIRESELERLSAL